MDILLDANILLRVSDASSPDHTRCAQALLRARSSGHKLFWCAQTMIEYWVVATRPVAVNGLGLTPADVELNLQGFDLLFTFLPEPPHIGARWRALVNHYNVQGRTSHDTRLVAFLLEQGLIHLLTLNTSDFARYTGIVCLLPENV